MQDLHVAETLPQMVELSEAYMQIYEQQTNWVVALREELVSIFRKCVFTSIIVLEWKIDSEKINSESIND